MWSLWEIEVEYNVALDAKNEEMKELVDKAPKLLEQEMGPMVINKTQFLKQIQSFDWIGFRDLQGNEDDDRVR